MSESRAITTTSLPPRAGLAMLHLQLRSASQAASDAESAIADVDLETARAQLRERLDPMLADHRAELERKLEQVRGEAAAEVAAAHRAAAVLISQLQHPANHDDTSEPADVGDTEPAGREPVTEPVTETVGPPAEVGVVMVTPAAQRTPGDHAEDGDDPWTPNGAAIVGHAAVADVHVASAAPATQPLAVNVVIDAEAFARVFASVFASMTADRPSGGPATSSTPNQPPPTDESTKQSFWTHARHPDVLLMSVAALIVLIVLASWLA